MGTQTPISEHLTIPTTRKSKSAVTADRHGSGGIMAGPVISKLCLNVGSVQKTNQFQSTLPILPRVGRYSAKIVVKMQFAKCYFTKDYLVK